MRRVVMWCVVAGILFAGIAITSYYIIALYVSSEEGPWYGRAKNLRELPYCVVSGPVDATRGIKGLLEIGMTKSALHEHLGQPLIPALSEKRALEMIMRSPNDPDTGASLDIGDFTNEFYGGVFAWVYYGKDGRVDYICFNPAAFNKKFRGKQKIAVAYHGSTFIVDEDTSQTYLVRLMNLAHIEYNIEYEDTLMIKGTRLAFVFDHKSKKMSYMSME